MDIKTEAIVVKTAKGMEVAGSGVAVTSGFGGWVAENHDLIWASGVFVGAFCAVAGLLVTLVFKIKSNRRDQERHEMDMKAARMKIAKN